MCSFPKISDAHTESSGEIIANLFHIHSGSESMFETILTILSVKDLNLISPTNLLTQIGMDFEKQYHLKKKLKRNFGVELIDRDLKMMTIGKCYHLSKEVQQFQKHLNENEKIVKNKLLDFNFFISLGNDHIRSEHPDTIMYQVYTKSITRSTECFVVLLPGLDGDVSHFSDIGADICYPNFIVKYGNNNKHIGTLASDIFKDIEKFCQDKRSFKLIGYSFGSIVAIELARALEGLNKNVKVICIDGSPLLFKEALHDFICDVDGNNSFDLQLATSIAHSIYPTKLPAVFRHQLRWLTSWDMKVQWLTKLSHILHSNIPEDNFQNICKGLFNRTYALASYEFDEKIPINSPLTLIKPKEKTIGNLTYDYSDDYGLKLCSKELVDVKIVQGNHYTILHNSEILNLINE